MTSPLWLLEVTGLLSTMLRKENDDEHWSRCSVACSVAKKRGDARSNGCRSSPLRHRHTPIMMVLI